MSCCCQATSLPGAVQLSDKGWVWATSRCAFDVYTAERFANCGAAINAAMRSGHVDFWVGRLVSGPVVTTNNGWFVGFHVLNVNRVRTGGTSPASPRPAPDQ